MSKEISVSYATYELILKCHEILKKSSLNMTVVELAMFFLRKHEEEKRRESASRG